MMHSGEMCDALLNGGIGETVKLSGDTKNLAAAMRFFKGGKMKVRGLIELDKSQCKGTNIRKVNLADADAVHKVFSKFTRNYTDTDKCRRAIIDTERNGLAACDGWTMLASRIPRQFPVADAEKSGFVPTMPFKCWEIAEDMDSSDYNLLFYRRMATVEKGDDIHGLLQMIRDAVMAYEHKAEDGVYNTLRLKVGHKFYDAKRIADIVDSLFKLGCTKVLLCEKQAWSGGVCDTTPMHLYGIGGEIEAKGVIMPVRCADDSLGAFVMPIEKE